MTISNDGAKEHPGARFGVWENPINAQAVKRFCSEGTLLEDILRGTAIEL
jgi:hypothetical protein